MFCFSKQDLSLNFYICNDAKIDLQLNTFFTKSIFFKTFIWRRKYIFLVLLILTIFSSTKIGVVSKILVDYPLRYYLSQNPDLNSSWNRLRSDTVYVIVNEFYHQNLTKTFGEQSKDYDFQKVKKYKYSTLFIGLKN